MESHTFTSNTRIAQSTLHSHYWDKTPPPEHERIHLRCDEGSEDVHITLVKAHKISSDHYKIEGEIEHVYYGKAPYSGVIEFSDTDESSTDITVKHAEFIRNYRERISQHHIEE